MSSESALSVKREKSDAELTKELEAVRATVKSLRAFLFLVRKLKNDLHELNNKCKELDNVNSQFLDLINKK